MEQDENEARRSQDRQITALSALLRFKLDDRPVEVDCTIRDVSPSGARLVCRTPLPLGQLVDLRIHGPSREIRAKAEVIRSTKLEGFGTYEAGVRFHEFKILTPRTR